MMGEASLKADACAPSGVLGFYLLLVWCGCLEISVLFKNRSPLGSLVNLANLQISSNGRGSWLEEVVELEAAILANQEDFF